MEQQLINAMMKLMSKAGAGVFIKDLVQQVDEDGNPKTWAASEIERAIQLVSWQTENFGTAEAVSVIETLVKKYNLDAERFLTPATPAQGAKGLQ